MVSSAYLAELFQILKDDAVKVLHPICQQIWKTQREGMGKEEGGGFRMGSTGIPVADSFRCLAKLIQYCKV